MGKDSSHRRAQSTFDYLILTTVVLVVIIPLLFISTNKLTVLGVSQLTEAVQTLKDGVISVDNLGYNARTRIIVRIPKGITDSFAEGNLIYFVLNGEKISVSLSASVAGFLPTNEGLHHINLYNDGDTIIFSQCGNNIREVTEQCDGKDADNCASIGLGCIGPNYKGACNCRCNPDKPEECPSNRCIKIPSSFSGYCAPCANDEQCGPGKICKLGVCQPPPVCPDCKALGKVCINGKCVKIQPCTPPLCADKRVCISGKCEPCDLNNKCPVNFVCNLKTGKCEPPKLCPPGQIRVGGKCVNQAVCGNNAIDKEKGEQCDGTAKGDCPKNVACGSATLAKKFQCQCLVCSTNSQCPGGYSCVGGVCKQGELCGDNKKNGAELCDGKDFGGKTCKTYGYTSGTLTCYPPTAAQACGISLQNCKGGNLANSCGKDQRCIVNSKDKCTCEKLEGPQCGNAVLEFGEECEPPALLLILDNVPCPPPEVGFRDLISVCTSACTWGSPIEINGCITLPRKKECPEVTIPFPVFCPDWSILWGYIKLNKDCTITTFTPSCSVGFGGSYRYPIKSKNIEYFIE